MRYETVHSVWHFYDGIRSGVADYRGEPHYFESPFDQEANDYFDHYVLTRIEKIILDRAILADSIFREWLMAFESGLASIETHPMTGNFNPSYKEINTWLDKQISSLHPIPMKFNARFRNDPGQQAPAPRALLKLQVLWSEWTD